MNHDEYKNFKDDVRNIKKQNIEEFLLMFNYCLNAYMNSVCVFGINSSVSKDIINFWREFRSIINEEKNILNFLLNNYTKINIDEVNNFICELDDLNEETIEYCYKYLEGIEDACSMGVEWKARRPIKNFDTLIDTDLYYKKMIGLVITFSDIKKYLGYEDEFWNLIDSKTYIIDSYDEKDKNFYGVNIKYNNKIVEDIKVFVPKIINLETALVNVHEFKHAYDLYELIGKEKVLNDDYYEKIAKESEKEFKNKYLLRKLKQ